MKKNYKLREGNLNREKLPAYTWDKFKLIMDNVPSNLLKRTRLTKSKVLQLYSFYCLLALTCSRPNELLKFSTGDLQFVKFQDKTFAIITLRNSKYKRYFKKKLFNGERLIVKRLKQDDKAIKRIPINLDNKENHFLIRPIIDYITIVKENYTQLSDIPLFTGLNRFKLWWYFLKATGQSDKDFKTIGLNIYAIKHIAIQHLVVDKNVDQKIMENIVGHRDSNYLKFYYNLQVNDILKELDRKGA